MNNNIRSYFPILNQDLIYFDNSATAATCSAALKAMDHYYKTDCFNIHRGVYRQAQKSEKEFEDVREKVRKYIGATYAEEIIFTFGTTDAINNLSSCFLLDMKESDNIVITEIEHSSNYLPWKKLSMVTKCELRIAQCDENGLLSEEAVIQCIDKNTKIVAISGMSNVTGVFQPINEVIKMAHENKSYVIVDASQLCSHTKINVKEMDCDFLCFSSHKFFGPTGSGILYGKREILNKLNVGKVGGGMVDILNNGMEKDSFDAIPYKFEAGTPPLAEVIGLGATIDFINSIDFDFYLKKEKEMGQLLENKLVQIPKLNLIGNTSLGSYKGKVNLKKAPIFSFSIEGITSYDLGLLLSTKKIAVRTGNLCAQPLLKRIKESDLLRVSLSIYNTEEEIGVFVETLNYLLSRLKGEKCE